VVLVGSEDASPLPAEWLVVVAVSSMGAGPPIDCASFTTSWVICSAITICVTMSAGKENMLEQVSSFLHEQTWPVIAAAGGRSTMVHVLQVRCKAGIAT
jgi:uncharacterized membrane protein